MFVIDTEDCLVAVLGVDARGRLKRMFSYYGSKSKIAHLYPPPKYRLIIEPFAGSARYALQHWENDVWLFDASETVAGVWRYLIEASEQDILSLPEPPSKVHIDDFAPGLSQPEKDLIGFHLCRGKAKPRKTGHGQNGWARDKQRIAANLRKIRHWKIFCDSYVAAPNRYATYFIDPPYQQTMLRPGNSDRYEHWSIDYKHLSKWIDTRLGQVIVCEGDGADWMPFSLMRSVNANTNNAQVKRLGEYVFIR